MQDQERDKDRDRETGIGKGTVGKGDKKRDMGQTGADLGKQEQG